MFKCLPFILLLFATNSFAQNKAAINNNSKNYLSSCYPASGLPALIQANNNRGLRAINRISDHQIDSLSDKELLVYVHEYPESYWQICAGIQIFGHRDKRNRLKAYIPSEQGGFHISDRQREALAKRKAAIVPLIDSCIRNHNRIRDDLKQTIVYLKAYELIPTIINIIKSKYNSQAPDTYLYTLLMLLMKNDAYNPFTSSEVYQQLYDNNKHTKGIKPSKSNCDFITTTANKYYAWKKS